MPSSLYNLSNPYVTEDVKMWELAMDDNIQSAVSADNAPAETTADTTPASVEQTTYESDVTSEKTETTQDGQEEATADQSNSPEEQMIPYNRFKEVNDRLKQAERAQQVLDTIRDKPELAESLLGLQVKRQEKQLNPTVQKALDTLREAGVPTLQDVEQLLEQREQQQKQQQQISKAQESFLTQSQELSGKYDGSDGAPKFDAAKVAEYMDTHGFVTDANGMPDVESAFILMNKEAFIDAQAKKARSTTHTETKSTQGSSESLNNKADLEEAKQSGDFTKILMKRARLPSLRK